MNNNYAEQAIRPFTIGCKNFVMIESSNGASILQLFQHDYIF